MKIVHLVYQSLPNISGSSIRTRDIMMSQKRIGIEPIVISSPFQNGLSNSSLDFINEIKHYRTYNNKPDLLVKEGKTPLYIRLGKALEIVSFYNKTKKIIKEEQPDIIHAHATFFCAFTAIYLGKKFKLPVCYEVRSLWEEREKSISNGFIKNMQPKIITFLETFAMKRVDKVIVINENLKNEMLSRNISNIDVVPNAVNLNLIKKEENRESSKGTISFGYIGSISPIEGLDLVAKLWKELENEGLKNDFHVFGDGSYYDELKTLVIQLKLKHFHLHGKVSSESVYKAFSEIDVIVNARLKSKISDTVTPLKPLEAMGYKKLVIASDVGGMMELIKDKKTGLLFKANSSSDLKKVILSVINNGLDNQIINTAYDYVYNNKSWNLNAQHYYSIYEKLLNS